MRRFITIMTIIMMVFAVNIHESKGQDPQFTQFYANPLYLNPAFAGAAGGPRFALNYRNQWPNIEGNYVTYAASYDQHFDAIGGGVGVQVMHDVAGEGELSTTIGSAMYSYQLEVTREFAIKAGLQASIHQRSIDFSKLRWGDQIHPRRGFIDRPTQEPLPAEGVHSTDPFADFSAGFIGFTENYYGGFAIHHITEPTKSFYGNTSSVLPRKWTAHIGTMIPLDRRRNSETFISPNIMFQNQDNFTQVNFGAYYIHQSFVAGVWFRQTSPNSDALMGLVGVRHDNIRVGYSYDLTVSEARGAVRGSHEISLVIELDTPHRAQRRSFRELNCPEF